MPCSTVRAEKRDAGDLGNLDQAAYGERPARLKPIRLLDDLAARTVAVVEIREGGGTFVGANGMRDGFDRRGVIAERLEGRLGPRIQGEGGKEVAPGLQGRRASQPQSLLHSRGDLALDAVLESLAPLLRR